MSDEFVDGTPYGQAGLYLPDLALKYSAGCCGSSRYSKQSLVKHDETISAETKQLDMSSSHLMSDLSADLGIGS